MRIPLLSLFLVSISCAAEPGITPSSVLIGQCAALSGPAAGLGNGMKAGISACFAQINAKGGIHGRTLSLATADDAYDPDRTVDATVKLIEEDKVFALAGYVGTPTTKVAIPIVEDAHVPLVGPFTGAGLLRRNDKTGKPWPQVINLRASYGDETEALVERMTTDLGLKRLACFYQNDSFGLAGLAGVEAALRKRGSAPVAKGVFERNTVAVQKGLADIMGGQPDGVIMIGPYKPIAAFLKSARSNGLASRFATVSFVGTENLIDESGPDGDGVVISQVVPSPSDLAIPLVKDYRAALAASDPNAKPGYVSLEGYVCARLLALGLDRAGSDPTRAGLITAFETMDKVDLGGMDISLSPGNHQGSSRVFITRIDKGIAKPIDRLD